MGGGVLSSATGATPSQGRRRVPAGERRPGRFLAPGAQRASRGSLLVSFFRFLFLLLLILC